MISIISEKKECCTENLFSGSISVTHTNNAADAAYGVQLPGSFVRGIVRKKHGRADLR